MKRREFVRIVGVGGLGLSVRNAVHSWNLSEALKDSPRRKHWAWVTTNLDWSEDMWKERFALMRRAGINAILPEIYDGERAYYASPSLHGEQRWLENILPLAYGEGLETHAWMWSMPCSVERIRKEHPDWYAVNRKGESAAEKPAYVESYRFLCPSHPEVHEYLKTIVTELCQYDTLAGVHLDYIRYPDVILPKAIQPRYGLTQDREYPEFDYCYCDLCRRDFKAAEGTDPMDIEDPARDPAWRQFRYDRITHLVNDTLVQTVHSYKKAITAAVFPGWEMVRQEWPVWHLDAVLPMLYHTLYEEGVEWIRKETEKGVRLLAGRGPLYSGILVRRLSPDDLAKALEAALHGGANGVSLFHAQAMTDAHWEAFRRVTGG
jgi:uncharacterized lipoprotein YddW (UPF0748 family)